MVEGVFDTYINLMSIQVEYGPIFSGDKNMHLMADDFSGIAGRHPVSPQIWFCRMRTGKSLQEVMVHFGLYLKQSFQFQSLICDFQH
jgi:hypothetical protein